MEFTLSTSGYFYSDPDKMNRLEEFGFTFRKTSSDNFAIEGEPKIQINSLEELIQFSNKFGEIVLVDKSIEIYDDYRE